MAPQPTLYDILGLPSTCSDADIRTRYKTLARKYHPDKQAGNVENMEATKRFTAIAHAYEVLGDQFNRATYDNQIIGGEKHDLLAISKREATEAIKLMTVTFDLRRMVELSKGGLVVDDAWYGGQCAVLCPEKNASLVINVTRQLQCMVESSKLVLAKGDSKAGLPGIWDPCPGDDKALRLRYFFRGRLHEVVVADNEMLLAPMKSHVLKPEKDNQQNLGSSLTTTTVKSATSSLNGSVELLAYSSHVHGEHQHLALNVPAPDMRALYAARGSRSWSMSMLVRRMTIMGGIFAVVFCMVVSPDASASSSSTVQGSGVWVSRCIKTMLQHARRQ